MSLNVSFNTTQGITNDYATKVDFSNNDYKADLYPQSNILDIGDIAEFEHADIFADNEDSQGIGESIKSFVKNIFNGLFS